jgi:DNA-binding beta-propeller fold protein YncE
MRSLRTLVMTLFLAVLCLALTSPGYAHASRQPVASVHPPALDAPTADHLYISDYSGNEIVWQALATQGATPTTLVDIATNGGPPNHAVGLLNVGGTLLVANQNIVFSNPPVSGEIDKYNLSTGASLGALVPRTDPHAPCGPRGIILGPDAKTLYVANLATPCSTVQPNLPPTANAHDTFVNQKGEVQEFDVTTGQWLGRLELSSLASQTGGQVHPRGLVFGPDGKLYISLFDEVGFPNSGKGWIVRYDLATNNASIFASYQGSGCSALLNAPEGMAFGADGRLYTTVRGLPGVTDKILAFDSSGNCVHSTDLEAAGFTNRTYAEALVFGADGKLYLPIRTNGTDTDDVGAVRACAVGQTACLSTNDFTTPIRGTHFFYPIFGKTNPTTLAYGP